MRTKKMMETKKIRVSVPFREDIYKQIEEEADIRGVSIPTFVSFVIGDYIVNQQKIKESVGITLNNLASKEIKEANFSEVEKNQAKALLEQMFPGINVNI